MVKIGAKMARHGRYVTFQLAEVDVPRSLFRKILDLIDDLRRRRSGVGRGNPRQGMNDGRGASGWRQNWPNGFLTRPNHKIRL